MVQKRQMPQNSARMIHMTGPVTRLFESHFLHKPDFDCSIQPPPPMVRATGAPRAVVTAINSL